ncbi:50S ribosomal protein L9, partial [Candidatus Peregrinibacteria bacterium RIFOXYB2_FULL_32_7]
MLEAVLKKDVKKLGFKGDIVKIRPGFFRNYLFPQGFATMADKHEKELAKIRKAKDVTKKEQIAVNAKAIAQQLKNAKLKFKEKTTEKGTLYGSIDEKTIVEALANQLKIEIDKSNIKLEKHIKEIGEHEVKL